MKVLGLVLLGVLSACGEPAPSRTICGVPCGGEDAGVTSPNVCVLLTNRGCQAGQKCTWVVPPGHPEAAYPGCVPEGSIAIGQPCDAPIPPFGADDCVSGAVCHEGVCKQLCVRDHGFQFGCASGLACAQRADFLNVGGISLAGICEPSCDPLTQEVYGVAACGSTDPAAPDRGCYGYRVFTCAGADPDVLARTDRTTPRTNSNGNPYLNGCAPGYVPLLFEDDAHDWGCQPYEAYQPVSNSMDLRVAAPRVALVRHVLR